MLNEEKTMIPSCRGCRGKKLFLAIELGKLPLSNELHSEPQAENEIFPLTLFVCPDCTLGQVQDAVPPDRLFSDYRYLSSVSSTFLDHAKSFCQSVIEDELISSTDFVVEIASNDGYLLRNFHEKGIRVLGVEPAKNISVISESLGIPTLNRFFTADIAAKIRMENGVPKLIIANNVLAHVPNIRDFMKGLAVLCGPETLISIENPSILNILEGNQFDTIYHEHYSYLSCHSVDFLSSAFGLKLFDVESIKSHGGSNRYWLTPSSRIQTQRLIKHLDLEKSLGLSDHAKWLLANDVMKKTLNELVIWLEKIKASGQTVIGYGAAAKASTLLNAACVSQSLISKICDRSPEKVGRYMPRNNYEIIDYLKFVDLRPDHVLVFPWNISNEIVERIAQDLPQTQIWTAIPKLKRVK